MSFVTSVKEQLKKRLRRRNRHQEQPYQNSTATSFSFGSAHSVFASAEVEYEDHDGAGVGIEYAAADDLRPRHGSKHYFTAAINHSNNSNSNSSISYMSNNINNHDRNVNASTSALSISTGTSTNHACHQHKRPPSPYPPPTSWSTSTHVRIRSDSIDRRSSSLLHGRRAVMEEGVLQRGPARFRSRPVVSPAPPPTSRSSPDNLHSLPQQRSSRWIQRAADRLSGLKQASKSAVSKGAKITKKLFKRRHSRRKHGDSTGAGQMDQAQGPLENDATDGGAAQEQEDSIIQDLDLRYYYDPQSEDPVNRMVFVAGPEHFYHLALQLETSPSNDIQLYAKELFIRAACLGYAPAQFKLGICFELGLTHFTMDAPQSFAWYKRAALQGHADAELAVSGWYLTGHPQGLVQSEPLAYEWASKAANRGWSKAEYTLGHYHEVGIGVPQDLVVAKRWYLKAAAQGNERALLRLLVGNVGLEVDYAHLKDALLNENRNNPYLIHQLAQFHELRDYGLVPDEDAAFELYAAAAQADYAPAQYKLGACYEFGILGCPQDPVQAVHWYGQGAENGHVEALLALAGFYLDGSAGSAAEQSDEEAFRYVKAAAQRGVAKAEYITGFFLEYGLGVEKNTKEAKQWYHLACAKGVDSAERRLKELERASAAPVAASA